MLKKILQFFVIFITSIILIDVFLSIFFEKEVYNLLNTKIDLIPKEVSNKEINYYKILNISNIPYWETKYRGPYFNYQKEKKSNCRILGIGDSIMWGSGIGEAQDYLSLLSIKLKNTEIINHAIPGADLLQEIAKYRQEGLGNDTDLLLWHLWEDDFNVYKLVNGVLYDSQITLNDYGNPVLFSFIPSNINDFLIKYSYLYNSILKLKIKGQIKHYDLDNEDYVVGELEKTLNNYLGTSKTKKVLILLSPGLENDSYKLSGWKYSGEFPLLYQKIENKFKESKNIHILKLEEFFKGISAKDIRYDECCHFNENGHKIISQKLFDYIKTNNLLDEKCY